MAYVPHIPVAFYRGDSFGGHKTLVFGTWKQLRLYLSFGLRVRLRCQETHGHCSQDMTGRCAWKQGAVACTQGVLRGSDKSFLQSEIS